ncbi:hypothetical protein KKB18_09065 [bacterium]|nr:hypothetical protein [bacterium]
MQTTEQSFNLKYYLKILFRWKWYFIIPFFALILGTTIISFFLPEKYVASSIILAEKGKILNPLMRGVGVSIDDAGRLRNLTQKILNKPQLENVAKKLKLGENLNDPFQLDKTVSNLQKKINLETKGTDFFEISCKGSDPKIITQIVQEIVDGFLKQSIIDSEKDSSAAVNFMRSQLEVYKKKLEQSEQSLRDFKQKNIDEMPGTENVALSNLNKARTSLYETQLSIKENEMEINSLENQLGKEKEVVLKEKTVEKDLIFSTLRNMQKEYAELLSRYTENHPEVKSKKKQIEEIEKQIQSNNIDNLSSVGTETSSLNPTYTTLYDRLNEVRINNKTLLTREEYLKLRIDELEKKVKIIPSREEELARLTRDYSQNEDMYRTFLKKLEEARVSGQLAEENKGEKFSVVQPVKMPTHPVSPNRAKILLISLIFSAGLGIAIVFLMEFLDDTIKDYHEAEEFLKKGMVLGSISKITSQEIIIKQDYRDKLTLVSCMILLFIIIILGLTSSFTF